MTENAIVAICGAAIIITFLICVTSGLMDRWPWQRGD